MTAPLGGRDAMLRRLETEPFDLLVIGGGITGAGIAREAALRGLAVALVEQDDFGSGTSSRSTKLIHGGLRYLRQFEFHLVREAVRERELLLRMAPHLVEPLEFLFPVFSGDPDSLPMLHLAVAAYDLLAGRGAAARHRMLDRAAVAAEEPLLRRAGLRGGAIYQDARTDDARLTLLVLADAAAHGAAAANYLRAARLIAERGRIRGVLAQDGIGGGAFEIRARQVVAAAGPWADGLRRQEDAQAKPMLECTKGVHLAVARERLPIQRAVVMRGADGRIMFAVPRGAATYVGTTDTRYTGDPGAAAVTRPDAGYLLEAVRRTFPDAAIQEDDVLSAWAGIRPLVRPGGARTSPSAISRDYRLFFGPMGLVSVGGGKLTAFRAMASHIVDRVFPRTRGAARDGSRSLLEGAGGEVPEGEISSLAGRTGARPEEIRFWLRPYGAKWREVTDRLPAAPEDDPARAWHRAMTRYAAEAEMAEHLRDVFTRRTELLLFSRGNGADLIDALSLEMADALGWSEARRAREADEVRTAIRGMFLWRG